jgi:hypothetical protein
VEADAANHIFSPGPSPNAVRSADGRVLMTPAGWILLLPGDAALTRRVKAAGEHWIVQEKKGRKIFSRGVWAPAETIERIRAELEAERATPGHARRKEADARRREQAQTDYVGHFSAAVEAFLAFPPLHADLASRLARAVTEHATPVGSGTVARTKRIPVERRAEAAVIAWMRHQTTAYEAMAIPRIKGKRSEVRRLLAQHSKELLDRYRRGEPVAATCPLATALPSCPSEGIISQNPSRPAQDPSMDRYVKTYDTSSTDYKNAFQVFLAHTDEKKQIHRWLSELVAALPARNVFIDAGAGNGQLTSRLQASFQHTIAIEPSPALRTALATNCPGAEIQGETILTAAPSRPADLVLCSHVLYYVPEHDWLDHLERLASWLAPTGVLAVLLQSHDCDCTELLCRFTGKRPNLLALADAFCDHHDHRYLTSSERVLASVTTNDFSSAYTVAEFMLNLLPTPQPIPRADVEAYVTARFKLPSGVYRLSLDQDFLTIRHRNGAHS